MLLEKVEYIPFRGKKKNLYSLPFLKLESLLRTSSLQLISSHALSIVDCISQFGKQA